MAMNQSSLGGFQSLINALIRGEIYSPEAEKSIWIGRGGDAVVGLA